MYIYRISSPETDRVYIGMTIRTLKRRWTEHCCAARIGVNTPLYNAMRAYGQDAFKIEEIDTATTVEELRNKEMHYIEKFESHAKQKGFNLTDHGLRFGRTNDVAGETHYKAKLTDEIVVYLRNPEYAALPNTILQSMVLETFGVNLSRDCVRDARRGDSWKHLNDVAAPYKRKQGSCRQPMTAERRAACAETLNKHRKLAQEKFRESIKGKRSSRATLSDDTVTAIFFSEKSLLRTAEEYGISKKMVLLIKQAKTYRYLTERLQHA
jgi:hypothetical protein